MPPIVNTQYYPSVWSSTVCSIHSIKLLHGLYWMFLDPLPFKNIIFDRFGSDCVQYSKLYVCWRDLLLWSFHSRWCRLRTYWAMILNVHEPKKALSWTKDWSVVLLFLRASWDPDHNCVHLIDLVLVKFSFPPFVYIAVAMCTCFWRATSCILFTDWLPEFGQWKYWEDILNF